MWFTPSPPYVIGCATLDRTRLPSGLAVIWFGGGIWVWQGAVAIPGIRREC
jgi:hypothetical protein